MSIAPGRYWPGEIFSSSAGFCLCYNISMKLKFRGTDSRVTFRILELQFGHFNELSAWIRFAKQSQQKVWPHGRIRGFLKICFRSKPSKQMVHSITNCSLTDMIGFRNGWLVRSKPAFLYFVFYFMVRT